MSLKRILLTENTRIKGMYVDPEDRDDEDQIDQAHKLATDTGINILRDMQLHYIKVDTQSDIVVGALFISTNSQSFSFDVVVDRSYENVGYGTELVQIALDEYESLKDVYGDDFSIEVHVINPKMKSILKNKFGFIITSEISQREVIMTLP